LFVKIITSNDKKFNKTFFTEDVRVGTQHVLIPELIHISSDW